MATEHNYPVVANLPVMLLAGICEDGTFRDSAVLAPHKPWSWGNGTMVVIERERETPHGRLPRRSSRRSKQQDLGSKYMLGVHISRALTISAIDDAGYLLFGIHLCRHKQLPGSELICGTLSEVVG